MDDLFFITSKLFWNLFNPIQILLVLFVFGLLLCFTRWRGIGLKMTLLSGLIVLLFGVFPVGEWLIVPLERRFSLDKLPYQIEGIVLLGGAINIEKSQVANEIVWYKESTRYIEALALMQHYPDVPVIFTGFSSSLFPGKLSEVDFARHFFEEMEENKRIVYEGRARNTYENAIYSKELALGRLHKPWLLVTSAIHIPRSVGIFRKAGWNVIPAPVDYISDERFRFEPMWFSIDRLYKVNRGVKQWIGLFVYYLTDKIDEIFPFPERK